jgi:molecular chaperone GrpE
MANTDDTEEQPNGEITIDVHVVDESGFDTDVDAATEQASHALEVDLVQLATERDEYLDALQRLKADFDNYKKRVQKQQVEHVERATERVVESLLPVLDALDMAVSHGEEGSVVTVKALLEDTLAKQGLQKVAEVEAPFNPGIHEAVAHEAGDGEAVVASVMRAGYLLNGHLVRPAMVGVRGS